MTVAFGSKGTPSAPAENRAADAWTAERMASATEAGKLADEAHAEAERLRNGGQS